MLLGCWDISLEVLGVLLCYCMGRVCLNEVNKDENRVGDGERLSLRFLFEFL